MSPAKEITQRFASVRRRLASMLYESLLLLGVLSLAFLVPHLLIGIFWTVAAPGWVLWLHIFVVLFAYFGWLWRRSGQTLAMQTWKIKIESLTGGPLSQRQIFIRYCFAWPSLLFLGAGILWALFDREGQFLHDRLAGTRIIMETNPS
jgi:uncharacterized RDD family membrane protein YckC